MMPLTSMPAMSTPSSIEGRALRRRMFITAAMSAPDQAPVPGRGMATNIVRAKN